MNLIQSVKLIKKLQPYILVGLLVITLLAIIYFRYYKKTTINYVNPVVPPPQISTNPTQPQPGSYKFPDTKNVSIPKQLPVYQAETTNNETLNYQELASRFGITIEPLLVNENTHDGRQIIWQQSSASLIISRTNLSYSNYSAQTQGENLSISELQQSANDFIAKIPVIDRSLILDPQTVFISKEREDSNNPEEELVSAESFEGADFIEFNFKKYLSGLPLYYGAPSSPYLKIRLAKNGAVVHLSSKLFQDFSASENYILKSPEEAVSEVNSGRGVIVDSLLPDRYGNAFELFRTQPFRIETLEVKTITLAYYLSEKAEELIQPVFVFEGNFQLPDQQEGKATVFLPAIKN